MKNQKTRFQRSLFATAMVVIIAAGFFAQVSIVHAFSNPYENVNDDGWDRFDSEHQGVVGGTVGVVGDVVGDTLGALFGDLGGDKEDIVTFIGFKGGLGAPSKEGLDGSLTRTSSVRDFVIKTVDFALSFLALVAVIVIIYGGVLYVTSGGNDDQAGKGKKAIQYAAIGIVIIIASFAFVSTIINFVGTDGKDETTAKKPGTEEVRGSAVGQQTLYNLGSVEISNAVLTIADAYKRLVETERLLTRIEQIPAPKSPSEHRSYISNLNAIMSELRSSSVPLSNTRIAVQKFIDDYLSPFQNFPDSVMRKYVDIETGVKTNANIKGEVSDALISADIKGMSKLDFVARINSLVGDGSQINERITSDTQVEGTLLIVRKIIGPIADATSVQNALNRDIATPEDIQKALAGIDPNMTVGKMLGDAIEQVNGLREVKDNPQDKTSIDKLIKTLKTLDRLYLVIKGIKFVNVTVTSSVQRGNAPLVVELSGLGSKDPAGTTIADADYKWDPDGDGFEGITPDETAGFEAVECQSTTGPTIHCTYNKPGTYYAYLKIASKDPAHIAAGQGTLAIVVQPPIARITLISTTGQTTEDLRTYTQDDSGNWHILIDKPEHHVTTKEAQQIGVTYDASKSRGEGDSQLSNFSWNFGDGTTIIQGPDKKSVTHKYKGEGKYTVTLEVTDRNNRKDRKIFTVDVSAIAARVNVTKTVTEPDELIEFDGSISRSDNGQISSYQWQIFNDADSSKDVINLKTEVDVIGASDASVLRAKFQNPGSYTIKLIVTDSNASATTDVYVRVKSRKPRANFIMRACPDNCVDPAQPSLIELDANGSFDPDKADNDNLTYNWQIYNEIGEEIKDKNIAEIVTPNITLPGKNVKKLRIKFKKTGKYKVVLSVNDSHQDDSIRQEDRVEKEIQIATIVETTWDKDMKSVTRLVKGSGEMDFNFKTTFADSVEIDFGDGETNDLATENCEGISNDSEASCKKDGSTATYHFSHTYTQPRGYVILVKALSQNNGENTISRRVFVTPDDNPFAVIDVSIDGVPVMLPETVIEDQPGPLEVIRKQVLRFDASESISSSGTNTGLKYSWNFGDGTSKTKKIIDYSFNDITPGQDIREVRLTISEDANPNKRSETVFPIRVISKKPQATSLSIEKKSAGNVTPVEVQLTAEGAVDPDGKITGYQFWYFDPADADHKLGVIDTNSNNALLRIDTIGEENEEHEYTFCVSLTDNDNSTTECSELFTEEQLPHLIVKNGLNKAPTSTFEASATSVRAGETITFSSSGKDPDGSIVSYVWDTEGDGFQNDNPTKEPSVTHTYPKKSPENGFRVKLKVIDDKGAEGVSKEVAIHVTPKSADPEPNFTFEVLKDPARRVQFYDSSKSDTDHGAKIASWKWDFDTTDEFGCDTDPKPKSCNGDKTDDVDSTEQNPRFDFPLSKRYQIKLTVEDSDGNVATKMQFIDLIPGNTGASASGLKPNAGILRAELTAKLANGSTQLFEQIPNCQISANDNCKKKVIHIPITDCGADVSYFWSDSRGDIVNYQLDQNVFKDTNGDSGTNGDGIRGNDTDNVSSTCTVVGTGSQQQNCLTSHYERSDIKSHPSGTGDFRSRLLVTDRTNHQDEDLIDIYFEVPKDAATADALRNKCSGGLFSASVFKDLGVKNTIIFSVGGGVAVVLTIFGVAAYVRRGKLRV